MANGGFYGTLIRTGDFFFNCHIWWLDMEYVRDLSSERRVHGVLGAVNCYPFCYQLSILNGEPVGARNWAMLNYRRILLWRYMRCSSWLEFVYNYILGPSVSHQPGWSTLSFLRGGYVGYIYHVWLVVSTVCIYPSCFGMILNRVYPPKLPFCDGDKDDKPWVTWRSPEESKETRYPLVI